MSTLQEADPVQGAQAGKETESALPGGVSVLLLLLLLWQLSDSQKSYFDPEAVDEIDATVAKVKFQQSQLQLMMKFHQRMVSDEPKFPNFLYQISHSRPTEGKSAERRREEGQTGAGNPPDEGAVQPASGHHQENAGEAEADLHAAAEESPRVPQPEPVNQHSRVLSISQLGQRFDPLEHWIVDGLERT